MGLLDPPALSPKAADLNYGSMLTPSHRTWGLLVFSSIPLVVAGSSTGDHERTWMSDHDECTHPHAEYQEGTTFAAFGGTEQTPPRGYCPDCGKRWRVQD